MKHNRNDWTEEYKDHLNWNQQHGFRGGFIPDKCLHCNRHIDLCHCETGHSITQTRDNKSHVYEFCLCKETQLSLFDFLDCDHGFHKRG